ncbi:hypothetical protein HPB51_017663 [Rhipicephalus microplus]|uniref:C2H2-type domain-containing protein n=1 Tax=Rhipicephalus microplus TaxID=6941 RepID=A0A9J6E318_RHIMP|nr:hypothetical protein HPB51_017663 [Rhipicephalus microplus]
MHQISVVENVAARPAEGIDEAGDKAPVGGEDSNQSWYLDEVQESAAALLEATAVADFPDDPETDTEDYDETYTRKKKKKPKNAGQKKRTRIEYSDAEKPYSCEICGVRYKTRPGLSYHYAHSHIASSSGTSSTATSAPTDHHPPPAATQQQSLTLAVNKRGGSAVADAPGVRFRAPLWRHDGNGELGDSARGDRQGRQDGNARAESGAEPGEDRKKTAAANAAYKKLGHKIAERSIASYLPRSPANDYKIIICPKCGLALTKVPNTRLSEAVAAQIPWIKGQEKEVLIVNDKQGMNYDVTAYLAPHEDSGRGVVRGVDPRFSVEELTEAFGNSRNPPILGVRKLGNSSSAVIIFKNETVPRWMYCYGVPLKCVLYKKRYEVCYRCGQLRHRSDVCISDHVRCRGCGMTASPEDHACEPKCKLSGKGHLTADRKCKEAFRTLIQ